MSRPVRINIPDATYLIQLRAKRGLSLFNNESDRQLFLQSLGQAATPAGVTVYAFSLMENSALIFLRSGKVPLSKFVHRTQAGYFNRLRVENGKSQSLIQDRHRSILIEDGKLFPQILRRVHLAPIIGEHWSNISESRKWGEVSTNRWTSFSIYTGKFETPEWFDKEHALQHFSEIHSKPSEGFYRYVIEGTKSLNGHDILNNVVAMSLLGSKEFVDKYYEGAKGRRRIKGVNCNDLSRDSIHKAENEKLLRKIIRLVATHYDINPREITKPRARHISRKFVVELTLRHTFDANGIKGLGEKLGVSGSALAHLHNAFMEKVDNDVDLKNLLDNFEKEIKSW
jgi:REP-associated tyrosine transposase